MCRNYITGELLLIPTLPKEYKELISKIISCIVERNPSNGKLPFNINIFPEAEGPNSNVNNPLIVLWEI